LKPTDDEKRFQRAIACRTTVEGDGEQHGNLVRVTDHTGDRGDQEYQQLKLSSAEQSH